MTAAWHLLVTLDRQCREFCDHFLTSVRVDAQGQAATAKNLKEPAAILIAHQMPCDGYYDTILQVALASLA
jgi:hypothetical protein